MPRRAYIAGLAPRSHGPRRQGRRETGSGAKPATERVLGQLLDQLTAQDILLVTELSRLGRRLMDIKKQDSFLMLKLPTASKL